jgi:N-acetylglutamate synthase-like GNAT family acetyltransferase
MITIRKATDKDIPRLLELYQQLSFEPDKYQKALEADCRKVLKQIKKFPNAMLLVAEEDGKTVGTTFMAILPGFAHHTSPFCVVEYVVVDETCRSQGIGKALMDYCKERAKEAGCYKIMLTSDKRRDRAHKFYRANGFTSSAEGFRFYF